MILAPKGPSRLLKLGVSLGRRVDDLIGVAAVKTYRRWLREREARRRTAAGSVAPKGVGLPSISAEFGRMGRWSDRAHGFITTKMVYSSRTILSLGYQRATYLKATRGDLEEGIDRAAPGFHDGM